MSGLDVEHAPDGREPAEDVVDTELQDAALQQEIELVSELVVAASASDAPLTPEEIDQALGLRA